MKFTFLILAVILTSAFPVLAQYSNGITIVGKATVEKAPDRFTVVFTFEKRHALVDKAKVQVDNQVRLLLNTLEQLNIDAKAITSTHLQIFPIYPKVDKNTRHTYLEQNTNQGKVITSANVSLKKTKKQQIIFDVRRDVEVNLSAIKQYEVLLDKAVKIGVTRISPVKRSILDSDKYYQQALSQAVENARSKAKRIAGNLGEKLGKVVSVNEHAYHAPGKMMVAKESMSTDHSMSTYIGVNQISAEVTVTFLLQN